MSDRKQYTKQYYQENKDRSRERGWKRAGIKNMTVKNFNIMLKLQNNCCFICGQNKEQFKNKTDHNGLAVDHNHKTGEVRGLICKKCNAGLGNFKDNVNLLKAAISYLKQENSYE